MRVLVLRGVLALVLSAAGLLPLQQARAGCGLAPHPLRGHEHVRSGDLTSDVRLYGDSITYQATPRLRASERRVGVDAFWGRTTRPTVDLLLDDATRRVPRTVVLAIGTNDTRAPSGMAAEVQRARRSLPASTRVLWVNTYVEINNGWTQVDAAIATTPGVEVVDWARENLRARGAGSHSPLLSDGVHLTCAGAQAWLALVQQALHSAPPPA